MALPSSRTPSVETLDDPAEQRGPAPWQPPCELVPDPDPEHSMDVVLVDPAGPPTPAPPGACRGEERDPPPQTRRFRQARAGPRQSTVGQELLAHGVQARRRDPEDLCICCGSARVHTQHPLFEGGMCAPCKDRYLDSLFLYDDDGYQSHCSVCGAGDTLLVCESPDCTRCYCFPCVDALAGPGASGQVQAMSNWVCFLCLPSPRCGRLWRRKKWRGRLKAFYDRESHSPLEMYKTVPVCKRQPVRVLSVFRDIEKELLSLGFLERGSNPGRLKHLDEVTDVVRKDVEGWGPFDLVFGSTPATGHARAQPPGWFLFQFHRLLQYARPPPGSPRPFFWMFVDSLLLAEDSQAIATRFLEASPVTIQDACGRGAVRVWSNIPAVRSRDVALASGDAVALLAGGGQDALPPGPGPGPGPTRLVRSSFLPLREYFKYFSTEATSSL
ncbi:DNA (cytosine-5)-methyltransferase 3-like [Talpa occidentalis]|uniref:DNA (cytosine-5)-methyltransferase 3-like n=1 Tax=Talpa occidentalis TaxID=50954 RepID=UPI00188E367A|nr:DNA (cytosine-5)-methyltransferase 3-like [Talpa occidentalis]